jgi:hypothetical protein
MLRPQPTPPKTPGYSRPAIGSSARNGWVLIPCRHRGGVQVKPSGIFSLTEREHEYGEAALRKLIDDRAYDSYPDRALLSWTDADLWYCALRVEA